jgi:hypothetical protein
VIEQFNTNIMIFKNSSDVEVAQRPEALKFTAGATVTSDGQGTVEVEIGGSDTMEVVTATKTVTAEENGKTFFLSAAAGFTVTLPTAELGLRYKFIVKTAPTSNGYTIVGTPVAVIQGIVAASGAEDTVNGVAAANEDNVILVANQALVGDMVEFESDGTNWYVNGNVNTTAAITANT